MSPAISAPRHDLAWHWQTILGRLQVELPPAAFDTWLEGSHAIAIDQGSLLVAPRSGFMCDWLNQRMGVIVEQAVAAVMDDELAVRFVAPGATGSIAGACTPSPVTGTLAPSGSRGALQGGINERFTFDRYLPTSGNRLAYDACTRLMDADALPMSPVFVYGSPGTGKTHLLHALASRGLAAGWTVACMSAEQFTNRYLDAMRHERVGAFKSELRRVRLFVVDDLQYLAGRKGTQDEFAHTIDEVSTSGGSVVLASEVPPYEMDLPERVVSRLMAGVVAPIEPLLLDERRAFIEWLAREQRVGLPAWAVERIAGCEVPSVRLLQGAVNAAVLLQQSGLLDLRRLDARLTHLTAAAIAPPALSDRDLVSLIAKHFEVAFDELIGRSRSGSVGEARAVAAAALHARGRSFAQIGALLSGRDASTVKGICKRGEELIQADAALRTQLAA